MHELLLSPATATTVAVAFRPVLTCLVVECVDGLLEGQFDSKAPPESVAVALIDLMSFARHLDRQEPSLGFIEDTSFISFIKKLWTDVQ